MKAAKTKMQLEQSVEVTVTQDEKYFVGTCKEIGVFTQGKTIEKLKKNLREAIDMSLEDGENLQYGIVEHPKIILNFDKNL